MVRAIFGFMALGGFLCFMGYEEYQVSKGTTAEPEPISLVKLEHGVDQTNNHVEIGDHVAIYDGLVYSYTESKYGNGEPDADTRIDYIYYPVVSMAHPFMKSLLALQLGDASAEDAAQEEDGRRRPRQEEDEDGYLTLDNFRVLVRSSRFNTYGELPEGFSRENGLQGMIVNQISSLDSEERSLLRESFPNLDFDQLIILQEGRRPNSTSPLGLIGGGSALFLLGATLGVVRLRS